jgi:hypothetical protein
MKFASLTRQRDGLGNEIGSDLSGSVYRSPELGYYQGISLVS